MASFFAIFFITTRSLVDSCVRFAKPDRYRIDILKLSTSHYVKNNNCSLRTCVRQNIHLNPKATPLLLMHLLILVKDTFSD